MQSLLDVPDDIGVDAVSLSRDELTTDACKHERPQNLEAIDSAGKVRRGSFHGTVQRFEALHGLVTDGGDLRIDAAQTEVRAKANALRWSRAPHARLVSAGRSGTGERIMRAQCRHGIEHKGDVANVACQGAF